VCTGYLKNDRVFGPVFAINRSEMKTVEKEERDKQFLNNTNLTL
jgi:hypothetical protein